MERKRIIYCPLAVLGLITIISFFIIVSLPGCIPNAGTSETADDIFLPLLRVIPSNEDTLKSAYIQDLTRMNEQWQKYPHTEKQYAIGRGQHLSGYGSYYDTGEWKNTLGFVREDVESSVKNGSRTSFNSYQAVYIDVDRQTVEDAVKSGPLNDILQIIDYQGTNIYAWGEDNKINLSRSSNVRPLGIGGRLAYVDGFVFWTSCTDCIEKMIDSYYDRVDSLADSEDYQTLAQKLS